MIRSNRKKAAKAAAAAAAAGSAASKKKQWKEEGEGIKETVGSGATVGIRLKLKDCRRRGVLMIISQQNPRHVDGFAAVYFGDRKRVEESRTQPLDSIQIPHMHTF